MPIVVMNGAGAGQAGVQRECASGAATEGWPQGVASVLNKADGIHRGGARARVCGAGDAGVCGVRTAVWVWVRARRLTMSLSRIQGHDEGVGGWLARLPGQSHGSCSHGHWTILIIIDKRARPERPV